MEIDIPIERAKVAAELKKVEGQLAQTEQQMQGLIAMANRLNGTLGWLDKQVADREPKETHDA